MRELALTLPLSVLDAPSVSAIAARCIQLCGGPDHGGQPALIGTLVERYSPARVRDLLRERGVYGVAVAVDSTIFGAAVLSRAGQLRLCFVDPERQKRGVGRRLVGALEAEARRRWLNSLTVNASATAAPFFAGLGFDLAPAPPVAPDGLPLTPMWKALPR